MFLATAAKKFRVNENVDDNVGDDLATMINSLFCEGISDNKFQDLLKNVNRPDTYNALTKLRVNQLSLDKYKILLSKQHFVFSRF